MTTPVAQTAHTTTQTLTDLIGATMTSSPTLFLRSRLGVSLDADNQRVLDYVIQQQPDGSLLVSTRVNSATQGRRSHWGSATEYSADEMRKEYLSHHDALAVSRVSQDCPAMELSVRPSRVTQTRANSALRFAAEKAGW